MAEWALVKLTSYSDYYTPVEITRRGKRFTFANTRDGREWRFTTRGLWDGFATEDEAYAMLDKMRTDSKPARAATVLPRHIVAEV